MSGWLRGQWSGALLSRRRVRQQRVGGDIGIGREPHKARALQARELVFPHAELGADGEFARGKEVHDMAGGDLGRAKVEGKFTTVGKVAVGRAPRIRQGDGAQAAEAIQM